MKKIPIEELGNWKMTAGNEKKYSTVIHNGHIKEWVGIGWVIERDATKADYKKYPEVDDE